MDDIFSFVDNFNPDLEGAKLDRLVIIDSANAGSSSKIHSVPNLQSLEASEKRIEELCLTEPISKNKSVPRQDESASDKNPKTFTYQDDMDLDSDCDNVDFCTIDAHPLPFSQCGPNEDDQPTPFMEGRMRDRSTNYANPNGVWSLDYAYKCLYKNKHPEQDQDQTTFTHHSMKDYNVTIPSNYITFAETSLEGVEVEKIVELGRKLQLVIGLLIKDAGLDKQMIIPKVVDLTLPHLHNHHSYNPSVYRRIIQNKKEDKIHNPHEYDFQAQYTFEQRICGWFVAMTDRKSSRIRDLHFSSSLTGRKLRSFKEVISYILHEKLPGMNSKKRHGME